MTWEAALSLVVTAIVFFGFVREKWPPEITAFTGVSLLLGLGILPLDSFLAVFANSAPMTIGAMFVISAGLERTGVIGTMGQWACRFAKGSWLRAILIVLVPVMALSAFVNNTPVVVILTPVMLTLARESGIPATKFLIPLSFISIFGGTCTLLGTSTNILVDGLAQERGFAAFGIFEITSVGLIMALAGIVYMLLFGWWLLPNRTPPTDAEEWQRMRRYISDFIVPEGSSLTGKRIAESPIAAIPGTEVLDLMRSRYSLKRSLDTVKIAGGDRLVIESSADGVAALQALESIAATDQRADIASMTSSESKIIECIVGPESRISGLPIVELDLPRRFGVYCIGVHRQKKKLDRDFDKLRLRVGDRLLLCGPEAALDRLAGSRQFVNVSTPKLRPARTAQAPLAVAVLIGVVASAAIFDLPIASLAIIGATFLVLSRCIDPEDAYESIQWPILLLIYGMLAIGHALDETGAMSYLVGLLTNMVEGMHPIAVLSVLYLLTSVLTEVMSNNAAAILLTPVAIGLADAMGIDARPLLVTVMLAGSASFATPIGYQTNTFVYRAGNYRFVDFVKIGLPLNVILWGVATLMIPKIWPFAG